MSFALLVKAIYSVVNSLCCANFVVCIILNWYLHFHFFLQFLMRSSSYLVVCVINVCLFFVRVIFPHTKIAISKGCESTMVRMIISATPLESTANPNVFMLMGFSSFFRFIWHILGRNAQRKCDHNNHNVGEIEWTKLWCWHFFFLCYCLSSAHNSKHFVRISVV